MIGQPNPLGALFGPGVFGRERLRRLVERYLDDDLIRAIAREDQRGGVCWSSRPISTRSAPSSGTWAPSPQAARRKPLICFAKFSPPPRAFPWSLRRNSSNVEADDKVFQEMHADGTLSAPVYTLPDAVLFGGKPILRAARPALYVIVNARIDPGFAVVPDQVEAIAAQSLSTLNRVGTKAVLAETYDVASREGLSFHLSYIGQDHPDSGGTGFETDAMRQLYDYGYEKARSGAFWMTELSQIEAAKDAATRGENSFELIRFPVTERRRAQDRRRRGRLADHPKGRSGRIPYAVGADLRQLRTYSPNRRVYGRNAEQRGAVPDLE